MKRLIAYLLSALVTAALSIGMPQSAPAMTAGPDFCDQASRHWASPFASTGYGPVARYTQVAGGEGRVGFYSPLTGTFNPESGWMDVHVARWYEEDVRPVGSPYYYETIGYGSFETGYGPVVWATQYADKRSKIRWGTWSLVTNRFNPATYFMPTAGGQC